VQVILGVPVVSHQGQQTSRTCLRPCQACHIVDPILLDLLRLKWTTRRSSLRACFKYGQSV
jgi:hypothetical protein